MWLRGLWHQSSRGEGVRVEQVTSAAASNVLPTMVSLGVSRHISGYNEIRNDSRVLHGLYVCLP
jgi:hypothetical protein